jgi:heme/copper-type cytochrome/quinol oxidase subunit 2
MLFSVRAVSETDYEAWLAKAKTDAANGSNDEYSIYTGPTRVKVRGGYLS